MLSHENHHVKQSVEWSNEAFGTHITGASSVTAQDWSFSGGGSVALPKGVPPAAPLVYPAGGGRIYNHYLNINGDNDVVDAVDLNGNGDLVSRVVENAIAVAAGGPRDVNGDGDQVDVVYEKEDLDSNGDDVSDWVEAAGVTDLENDAMNNTIWVEDAFADQDWGDPGKNHDTSECYD